MSIQNAVRFKFSTSSIQEKRIQTVSLRHENYWKKSVFLGWINQVEKTKQLFLIATNISWEICTIDLLLHISDYCNLNRNQVNYQTDMNKSKYLNKKMCLEKLKTYINEDWIRIFLLLFVVSVYSIYRIVWHKVLANVRILFLLLLLCD